MACVWEARAHKVGNVNPRHSFPGLTVDEFYRSATAIAPVLEGAAGRPVGETVLEAIQATRQVVATNTNLGAVLLLAPLAAVPRAYPLKSGIEGVLNRLTINDSRNVFAAIRLAQPAGLGVRKQEDVHGEPTLPLREVMYLAMNDDLIALQYIDSFAEVLDEGVPALLEGLELCRCLENAIIYCHLKLLAAHPDSLIARKRGLPEAQEASRLAKEVLAAGWPTSGRGQAAIAAFDAWLRAIRNQRNPGTTADLVAASLFAALREGIIKLPCPYPWSK